MNELCVSLQGKYEEVIDLIERERNEIWDFPTTNEEANKINFVTYQSSLLENKTEFNRLGSKHIFKEKNLSSFFKYFAFQILNIVIRLNQ